MPQPSLDNQATKLKPLLIYSALRDNCFESKIQLAGGEEEKKHRVMCCSGSLQADSGVSHTYISSLSTHTKGKGESQRERK